MNLRQCLSSEVLTWNQTDIIWLLHKRQTHSPWFGLNIRLWDERCECFKRYDLQVIFFQNCGGFTINQEWNNMTVLTKHFKGKELLFVQHWQVQTRENRRDFISWKTKTLSIFWKKFPGKQKRTKSVSRLSATFDSSFHPALYPVI